MPPGVSGSQPNFSEWFCAAWSWEQPGGRPGDEEGGSIPCCYIHTAPGTSQLLLKPLQPLNHFCWETIHAPA